MRFAAFLAIGAPALTLAACSLVTSLDGLRSVDAPDAGSAMDGAIETGADGFVEASGDAVVDVAPAPFCSGNHALCADFDRGALLDGWTGQKVDPLGMTEESGVHFVSPAASFHSFLARRAAGDKEYAVLQKALPGEWKRTIVDFDLLLERPDFQTGDLNAAFLALTFAGSGAGSGQTLYLAIGSGSSQLSMAGLVIQLSEAPYDAFFHVHLDVQPGTSLSATVDGKMYQGTLSAITGGPGTKTEVDVGVTGFNAPVPAFSAYYDNIVVDQL